MDFERAFSILATCAIAAFLLFMAYAGVQSARANGNIDYCYVEMLSPQGMAPQYQLYGHRPWRADRAMGVYPTLEVAKNMADTVGCKFN